MGQLTPATIDTMLAPEDITMQHLDSHLVALLADAACETGFDSPDDMLQAATFDGVATGICVKCGEVTDSPVEPDAHDYTTCQICEDGGKVHSCLVIARPDLGGI